MLNKNKKASLEFQMEALQEAIIESREKVKEYDNKGDWMSADLLQMEIIFMEANLQELENEYFFLV